MGNSVLRQVGASALMALAFGVFLDTPDASAQSSDQAWAYCNNTNNQYGAELQIGGCTAVIQNAWADQANMAIAFYNRGSAYYADGPQHDYARAIADFNQAIAHNPQFAYAFHSRGEAYQNSPQHDYARAIADYDQAIALNPQFAMPFAGRGNAYQYGPQHDYARAIADYDQAGALDPNNAGYQNDRCWNRAIANRELDVARAACDAGLRITPNDANIMDSRGMVGLKQQRWQDAWNDYDAAARINPNDAAHVYGRGIAALRLGRTQEGQADLAHAAQLDANIAATYAGYGVTP